LRRYRVDRASSLYSDQSLRTIEYTVVELPHARHRSMARFNESSAFNVSQETLNLAGVSISIGRHDRRYPESSRQRRRCGKYGYLSEPSWYNIPGRLHPGLVGWRTWRRDPGDYGLSF